MAFRCLILYFMTLLLSAAARPEAPSPYYYAAPQINQNQQQSNLYGSPILRTSNSIQNNALSLSSTNYGTPDFGRTSHFRTQPVTIQKHIYVHVPPPDEEDQQRLQRFQQPTLPVQKHYKIIFVKVPAYSIRPQYVAQQQAPQQEKTLIYVLVKKPEDAPEVTANQVAQQPINKPEVYFIKYKAKSEESGALGGQVENNDDSVVIESAAGRNAAGQRQGYNYDRPDLASTLPSANLIRQLSK